MFIILKNMQFTFPSQQISSIKSLEEAKRTINSMLQYQNLFTYCTYKFKLIRGIYIYCLCRDCHARLVFKKKDNAYELFKINSHHKHSKITKNNLMIIQAIRNYPSCFNTQTIKQQIMNRFQISSATFYRRFIESQTFGKSFDDVLAHLQSEGIFGVCIRSQNSSLPSLLLLTSQIMIQKYHKNDRNVKFDLTYNLIREKTSNESQYSVGIFLSLNNNLNIEPHCLVVMENQSKQSFVRMFTQFFIIMKQAPNSIITDQQKNIHLALQQLQERSIFHGHHFIDVFHVLRNAKKALYYKPSINYFVSLSRSTNLIEYRSRREKCQEKICQRDRDVLIKFESKMEKCCIALLPPVFIGLTSTTAASEKINDMIKQKIPYSKNYIDVIGITSKLLEKMVRKPQQLKIQKTKLEEFTVIQQIEEIRYRLNKRMFKRLMLQLSLSATCLINLTQNLNVFEVTEQDYEGGFIVQFTQSQWHCDCQLREKIGIPCAHILKVILLRKQKICEAINTWWLFNTNEVFKPKRLQYPRKTRRHKR